MNHFLLTTVIACAAALPVYAQDISPLAPAAATDVAVSFPSGSLEGYVSFTAPRTSFNGNSIEGNLDFSILVDGVEINSGKVYSGVNKDVAVTMKAVGEYDFSVITSNSFGSSPAVTVRAGAGYVSPLAPVPAATISSPGEITISWAPVTRNINGFPINTPVTYSVTRNPDGKVISSGTSSTSVTDSETGSELQAYTYSVTAWTTSTPSEEGISNPVVTGAATAPWSSSFDTQDEMDYFTIINRDGDSYTWEYYYGEVILNVGSDNDADDWLISPPVKLATGKYHTVSVDLKVRDADYPGKVELLYGNAPTPEAMTNVAIPVTEFNNQGYMTFSGKIAAIDDSPVYFAIHSVTEAGNWHIYATKFSVSAPLEGAIPVAPTDFTATPDINGALVIDLSLKAPAVDLDGNKLESIEKIEIFRDGTLIHTVNAPVPGNEINYTDDNGLTEGAHTYTAIATNATGTGPEAKVSAYAGINIPAIPAWASAVETDVNGIVTVSWAPVTTYEDGAPLNPDNVTYCIWTNVTGSDMKIFDKLTGTSHTFRIMAEGEPQLFFQFGVTAETAGGENLNGAMTEYIPVGEPENAPYEDSFADLSAAYTYVQGGSERFSYWDNASDSTFEEVKSQDGDNGMLFMYGYAQGSTAYLHTTKVSLAGLTQPMLTFYTFNLVGDMPDDNTIEVLVNAGEGFNSLGTWKLSDFGTEDWHRIEIPLTDFADKDVQFKIIGTTVSYQYIQIDNIQIRDRFDNDIAITAVTAPERVKAGNSLPIVIDYANFGLSDAARFTIEVTRDGENVASETISGFPSDARGSITIPVLHSVTTPEYVEYNVRAVYDADMLPTNNAAEPFEAITIYPTFPVVDDLTATYPEENRSAITLNWSAPDLSGTFEDDITEGFESSDPWATSVDGWTFIDADKAYIYGFEPWIQLPAGAPAAKTQQSWWVIDATYRPMIEHFSDPQFYAAHSGTQYICSMAVTDPELTDLACDDWAISPELYGGEQTISFWAKSMLEDAPESFEILYSTTGKEISDFVKLESVNKVPWSWTQYYAQLPDGARYFAIRHVAYAQYVLMIDDINFIPAGPGSDLEIEGYNVYRDGKILNETPVKATTFADQLTDNGTHTYNVTALYLNRGESNFSNTATPVLSSIDDIASQGISLTVEGNEIVITGAQDRSIAIYSVDGILNHSASGTGNDRFAVNTGVYIVKIGTQATKVVVK